MFVKENNLSKKLIIVTEKITEIIGQYNDAGIDKISAPLFEEIAQEIIKSAGITGSNKVLKNAAVKIAQGTLEGVKKKFGKTIAGGLTYDVMMNAMVDSFANATKDVILNVEGLDKRLAIIGAATSWIAIKQAYNIASSGNAAELVVSQAMLLVEVAQENIEETQKFIAAMKGQKKAQVATKMMDIYSEQVAYIASLESPHMRVLALNALEQKFKAERDKLKNPYYGYAFKLTNNLMVDVLQWEKARADSVYPFPKDISTENLRYEPCGVVSCDNLLPHNDNITLPPETTTKTIPPEKIGANSPEVVTQVPVEKVLSEEPTPEEKKITPFGMFAGVDGEARSRFHEGFVASRFSKAFTYMPKVMALDRKNHSIPVARLFILCPILMMTIIQQRLTLDKGLSP